ncbi:hypothetical protein ACIQK5_26085 [Streptomyces virginiae]|uniref:hypothetical protein n=1 Tax=Streptomyces TaxID=1883 RepID=UPI00136B2218|nr:hypothetical protein [Streptomyces sp. SID1046]MYV77396.1 hypothetical protein [Streptomyces sp. SID1046]
MAPAVEFVEEAAPEDTSLERLPETSTNSESGTQACDNPRRTWYEITSKSGVHMPAKFSGTSFKDGPGGTMVVKVERAGKVLREVSAGGEVEVSGIVAKAKVSVSAKIGTEVGITVGHEYRRNVTSGKYGHLQYGSWGYNVKWAKYETSADRCGKKLVKSGTAKLPTSEVGWNYWETNS